MKLYTYTKETTTFICMYLTNIYVKKSHNIYLYANKIYKKANKNFKYYIYFVCAKCNEKYNINLPMKLK